MSRVNSVNKRWRLQLLLVLYLFIEMVSSILCAFIYMQVHRNYQRKMTKFNIMQSDYDKILYAVHCNV